MRLTTDALIIRENNNIGEADRFVTALTRELAYWFRKKIPRRL